MFFFLSNLGEELGLFRPIIQRSNLDGGHINLDGGIGVARDGGPREPAPPPPPPNQNTTKDKKIMTT